MPTLRDIFLKPLFKAVAWPGIGLPHHGHEAELMLAGVKPAAIVSHETVVLMQKGITDGHLVHIGTSENYKHGRIYCQPDAAEYARKAAIIIEEKGMMAALHTTPREGPVFEIFSRPCNTSLTNEELLIEGQIKAVIRFKDISTENLDVHAAAGAITMVDLKIPSHVYVYAQNDKITEGRELYSRYFLGGKGYDKLGCHEEIERVGQLLGYTKRDTDFFIKWKAQEVPRTVQMAHDFTNNVRREARIKLMMWDR